MMEIPEDPGPTAPLRPSQIPIRPPPPRVAPKRKLAMLDFTDGPLSVNQLRLCRSVLVKRLRTLTLHEFQNSFLKFPWFQLAFPR